MRCVSKVYLNLVFTRSALILVYCYLVEFEANCSTYSWV